MKIDQAEDRDKFLQLALNARSELDALMFQRIAEMMSGYHQRVAPVQRIVRLWEFPVAFTADQKLAAFLPLDYANWSPASAEWLQSFAAVETGDLPAKGREVWLTGRFSPLARAETAALGIVVHENALAQLQPPPTEPKQTED